MQLADLGWCRGELHGGVLYLSALSQWTDSWDGTGAMSHCHMPSHQSTTGISVVASCFISWILRGR